MTCDNPAESSSGEVILLPEDNLDKSFTKLAEDCFKLKSALLAEMLIFKFKN